MAMQVSYPRFLPGPRPMPILGKRGNKLLFYRDPIAYHRHVYQTYGAIAAFVQGSSKVLIYSPEYNRQVMSQPDLFYAERIALPGPPDSALHRLGLGLNIMNGEQHQQQRRLIMPMFHKQSIAGYCDEIIAITGHFLDRWNVGEVHAIEREMRQITLCIVSQILFGIDARSEGGTLVHLLERWIAQMASVAVWLFPFPYIGSPYKRVVGLSEHVEARIRDMIAYRRANPATQRDILALLIHTHDQHGGTLSDDELIGQSSLLFFAGFETTTIALTWTLFLLAQHPRVAADLLDELDAVLQGAPPTVERLASLPLLDAVIKESLRLLPPSIQGGRISTQPFEMGPYQFPTGTKVMYSQYITHHLPELYPEPERFLPERWRTINPSPYEYLPFLAGPRMCIGAMFATVEMKIVLSMLIQRYRLSVVPHTRIDRQVRFTLVPKDGMPMRVVAQDRQFTKVPVRGNIHEMVDLS